MPIELSQFHSLLSSGSGFVHRDDPDKDTLKLGGFRAHKVGLEPSSLKDKEKAANALLKREFLRALSTEYDSMHVMEIAGLIQPDKGQPLSLDHVRTALRYSMPHRLMTTEDSQAYLGKLCPEDANSESYLDKAIEKYGPIQNRQQLRELIGQKAAAISGPFSQYTLEQLVRHVTRDYAASQNQVGGQVGLQLVPQQRGLVLGGLKGPGTPPLVPGGISNPQILRALGKTTVFTQHPSTFFNAVKLDPPVSGHQREWFINYTLLTGQADRLRQIQPQTPALIRQAKALDERAMGYLYKFANVANAEKLNWQFTPMHSTFQSYHRTGESALHMTYNETLNSGLRSNEVSVVPVSSPRALDAVKRQFELAQMGNRVIEITPSSGPHLFSEIVRAAGRNNNSFFLDINYLLEGIQGVDQMDGPQIQQVVKEQVRLLTDMLEVQVREYVEAEFEGITRNPLEFEQKVREMMAAVSNHVVCGGNLKIGGQPMLLLAKPPGSQSHFVDYMQMVNHTGYTSGPGQILEQWSQLESRETIMARMFVSELPALTFPSSSTGLDKYSSFQKVMAHPAIRDLQKLMVETAPKEGVSTRGSAPYICVLGNVTMSLLEGLQKEIQQLGEPGNDPVLGQTVQLLYNRILSHIANANASKGDMGQFINHMHLANEEIITLVALLSPHRVEDLDLGLPPAGEISPEYAFRNGGMGAFSSILSGVEAQKGSRSLNVVSLEGIYYEEQLTVLEQTASYRNAGMDGSDVKGSIARIREKLGPDERVDLFVAEFHHNISTTKTSYNAENVLKQVRALLAADPPLVSDHLTIAIDTTIAKTDDPAVLALIEGLKQEIADGRVNLVLFRSGQKFDLSGFDHLSGGFMATYNKAGDYGAFNQGQAEVERPSSVNLQGMLHFQKHAQEALNVYRGHVMYTNSSLLRPGSARYSLPPSMVRDWSLGREALMVAPNTDRSAVFLDIRSPLGVTVADQRGINVGGKHDNPMYVHLKRHIETMAEAYGLVVSDRPSFGFPHLNITLVGAEKLRITMGLETDRQLEIFNAMLVTLSEFGKQAMAVTGNNHQAVEQLFSGAGPSGTKSDLLKLTCDYRLKFGGRMPFTFSGTPVVATLDPELVQKGFDDVVELAGLWASIGHGEAAVAVLDKLSRLKLTPQQAEKVANAYFHAADQLIESGNSSAADTLLVRLGKGIKNIVTSKQAAGRVEDLSLKLALHFADSGDPFAQNVSIARFFDLFNDPPERLRGRIMTDLVTMARKATSSAQLPLMKAMLDLKESEFESLSPQDKALYLQARAHYCCAPDLKSEERTEVFAGLVDHVDFLVQAQPPPHTNPFPENIRTIIGGLAEQLRVAAPRLSFQQQQDFATWLAQIPAGAGEAVVLARVGALKDLALRAAGPRALPAERAQLGTILQQLNQLTTAALHPQPNVALQGALRTALRETLDAVSANRRFTQRDLALVPDLTTALDDLQRLSNPGHVSTHTATANKLIHWLLPDPGEERTPQVVALGKTTARQIFTGLCVPDVNPFSSMVEPAVSEKMWTAMQLMVEHDAVAIWRSAPLPAPTPGQINIDTFNSITRYFSTVLGNVGPERMKELVDNFRFEGATALVMQKHPETVASLYLLIADKALEKGDYPLAMRMAETAAGLLPTGTWDGPDTGIHKKLGDLIQGLAQKRATTEARTLAERIHNKLPAPTLTRLGPALTSLHVNTTTRLVSLFGLIKAAAEAGNFAAAAQIATTALPLMPRPEDGSEFTDDLAGFITTYYSSDPLNRAPALQLLESARGKLSDPDNLKQTLEG
ncbi:hypothetical protein DB346_07240 [Verrucomicrobia bacterium LW23]|nr:hypothetical protein DB346_07240 [Verrucomicrobia bacterium LW23]